MPVYTYECEECGVRFDARQRFSEAPIAVCPECGGHTHRVPQPVGIVFKGSGWYSTDSRGRNNLAVPPTKPDAEAGHKKNAKSDAAPSSDSGAAAATPDTPGD